MKHLVFPAIALLTLSVSSCKKDARTSEATTDSTPLISAAKTAANGNSGSNGTQTAQSVMISFGDAPTEYIIENNQVWKFNAVAAAQGDPQWGYYGCNPATSGRNNGNACRNQAVSNAMSARCIYWGQQGHPYWTLTNQTSTGDPLAPVTFAVTIAGESYMRGGGFPNGKYSFTLGTDSSSSRINNLRYSVDGGAPVALSHTIVAGTPAADLGDVQYTSTGQQFGSSEVFQYLINGTMRDVLASDGANNNDGNNVYAFTAIGVTPQVSLNLGVGTHQVVVTGNVKGNDAVGTWNFSKTVVFHISAQGCQNPNNALPQ